MEPTGLKEGRKTSENLEEVSGRGAQRSQHHLEYGKKNSREQSPLAQHCNRPLFHQERNGLTNTPANSKNLSAIEIAELL